MDKIKINKIIKIINYKKFFPIQMKMTDIKR